MIISEAGCRSALARQNVWQRWPCGLKDRFGCPFLWFFLAFIPPTGGMQVKETNKTPRTIGVQNSSKALPNQ